MELKKWCDIDAEILKGAVGQPKKEDTQVIIISYTSAVKNDYIHTQEFTNVVFEQILKLKYNKLAN